MKRKKPKKKNGPQNKLIRRRRRQCGLVPVSAKIAEDAFGMLSELASHRMSISDAIEKAIRTEYRTYLLSEKSMRMPIRDAMGRP